MGIFGVENERVGMERWWDDTDVWKPKYSEKNPVPMRLG
jgi:hypothetical protein